MIPDYEAMTNAQLANEVETHARTGLPMLAELMNEVAKRLRVGTPIPVSQEDIDAAQGKRPA